MRGTCCWCLGFDFINVLVGYWLSNRSKIDSIITLPRGGGGGDRKADEEGDELDKVSFRECSE